MGTARTPIHRLAPMTVATLVLAASCSSTSAPTGQGSLEGTPPELDAGLVAEGEQLYDENCAACHGIDGAGDADWKTPRSDGSYPPPPHDATGHTWHHSDGVLVELVSEGSDFEYSRMPAFGGQLNERQIVAILEYVKTWWGPEERAFQWEASQQNR